MPKAQRRTSKMRKIQKYLERDVIYQINLRSFTNEGTLNAAAKMLGHIRQFADIVYLCPCFVQDNDTDISGWSDRTKKSELQNPANPYRISDYYNVDPEYGTNDDLKNFISEAHDQGLKVILDLVYFHCGPNSVFLEKHPDFIVRNADGTPDVGAWKFPKLNYDSPELCEYMIENMELYVRDYGVDGYRCDVGDNVPLDFWAAARERIDAINPELMMLNEGTKPNYIDVFDINYSWDLLRQNAEKVISGEKTAEDFAAAFEDFSQKHLQGSHQAITCLDNHDYSNDDYYNRLERRIGSKAMDAAFVINYLLPFVPFVYCGTEICDTNRHSIWGNRFHSANLTIDWQNLLSPEATRRLELLKKLYALRHGLPEVGLSQGFEFVKSDDPHVVVFVRQNDENRLAVVVNLSNEPVSTSVEVGAVDLEPWILKDTAVSLAGTEGKLVAYIKPFGYAVVELH